MAIPFSCKDSGQTIHTCVSVSRGVILREIKAGNNLWNNGQLCIETVISFGLYLGTCMVLPVPA